MYKIVYCTCKKMIWKFVGFLTGISGLDKELGGGGGGNSGQK
jgi:hypothetical protein